MSGLQILQSIKASYEENPKTWIQGKNRDWYIKEGEDTIVGFCLIGGINHFKEFQFLNEEAANQATGALYNALVSKGNLTSLVLWNDAEGRKLEEVIELLDEAINEITPRLPTPHRQTP